MSDAKLTAEKVVFETLPPAVARAFDGDELAAKIGFTVSLLTSDAAMRLHTSLLGPGEVFAPPSQAGGRTIRFALWPQSRAVRNVLLNQRAAMTFVLDAAFYQLQLQVLPLPNPGPDPNDASGLVFFTGQIESGEAQAAPYARLTNGIAFDLMGDAAAVLARWHQQVETLKRLR